MQIFIFRHANRKDRSKDKKERDSWFKSKRYKENPWDIPLSKLGKKNTRQMAENLLKEIDDITEITYFSVSPISRCMETAIHMIDHIFILTKHKIKIRIEYGFTKSLESIEMSYFENNSNYVEKNGIKYKTKIDSKLYPIALKKKYGSYLDKNFEKYSVQNYKDMGITSRNVNIKRAIKAFKSRLGGKNQVVITHACISFWFYMYATQKIPNPNRDLFTESFGGKSSVGIITGYEFVKKNVPAKVICRVHNKGVKIDHD
jgi:hypothetical protein